MNPEKHWEIVRNIIRNAEKSSLTTNV
uniref:(California timema) hypothetical protein n=1 Tax=Timema californicum TaxID=61474 RepID=A0A7R9JLT2_TIMCA|nr:unnamed protein product [Timema californicum]